MVCFTQSEFQKKLALASFDQAKIIFMHRGGLKYLFDLICSSASLFFLIITRQEVVIFDHRNPLCILAALIEYFVPAASRRISIGDDGLHSLLVDRHGEKFLYWNTSRTKGILIKFLKNRILKLRRSSVLLGPPKAMQEDEKFLSYFERIVGATPSFLQRELYIDQPLILESMEESEQLDFLDTLGRKKGLLVVLHPRRTTHNIFERRGLKTARIENLESELKYCGSNIRLHGFSSTVLLGAKYWGAEIQLYKLPVGLPSELKEYCVACQELIKSI